MWGRCVSSPTVREGRRTPRQPLLTRGLLTRGCIVLSLFTEPLPVKELRQHRLAIEAETGNDWDVILARAVEAQQKFAANLISDPTGSALLSAVDNTDAIEGNDESMKISRMLAESKASGN